MASHPPFLSDRALRQRAEARSGGRPQKKVQLPSNIPLRIPTKGQIRGGGPAQTRTGGGAAAGGFRSRLSTLLGSRGGGGGGGGGGSATGGRVSIRGGPTQAVQRQAAERQQRTLRRAQGQERGAFQRSLEEIRGARETSRGLFGEAREAVAGAGGAAREELERQRQRDLARIQQRESSRGLGSTTRLANLERGLSDDESRRLRALSEQESRLRGGVAERQAGSELGFGQLLSGRLAQDPFLQARPQANILQALLQRLLQSGITGGL